MSEEEGVLRLQLLKSLRDLAKSGAKLDASIVTTYAFNGTFYEEVLLRAFQRAGSRLNIVLVDAARFAECAGDPLRRPSRAGADYLLAPIRHSGTFHPKILALLSETRPLLALGSHNVTDAGFSHNEELTAFWGLGTPPAAGVLRGAVEYALHWLQRAEAVPASSFDEVVRRVRDLLPEQTGSFDDVTIATSLEGRSLWQQVRAKVKGNVKRVWVAGPYFDVGMHFLKAIDASLNPREIIVAIQPETTVLPRPDLAPKSVRFVDASATGAFWPKADERGFAHGKALAIETNGGLVVSLGSANPTGAAWLEVAAWNAEANVCLTGSHAATAFRALGLAALTEAPDLTASTIATIAERSQELRRREHAEGSPHGPPVLCGTPVDDGVFLPGFVHDKMEDAGLVGADGTVRSVEIGPVESGSLLRPRSGGLESGLHELQFKASTVAYVLLNDIQALKNASLPRDGARILSHLGAFDCGAGVTELLDLLDRHVLGTADPGPTGAGRTPTFTPRDTAGSDAETPFGPRGISLPSHFEKGSRQTRLNDGLIADIISALIRALGAAPPPATDGDAPDLDEADASTAPSSDQIARNVEAEGEGAEIDWPRLVTACRKRLTVMIRRLEARMSETAAGEHGPAWALGRLVVVLSLLQRLRVHPPQTAEALRGRARPTSLVGMEQLRSAFDVGVRAMYGTGGLAAKLEAAEHTRGAEERRLVDNLLLWFARETGADYRSPAVEDASPATLQARADIVLVAMSAAAHPSLETWAEFRNPWLSIWDDAQEVQSDWSSRQMAFGSLLHDWRKSGTQIAAAAPKIGDLVRWDGEPTLPWVLLSTRGRKGTLLEPAGAFGNEKKVFLTSLRVIDTSRLASDGVAVVRRMR